MSVARQRLGRAAEDLAARRLAEGGFTVVERNARTRLGELDLVALYGDMLVFVEVKAGTEGSFAGPERPALAVGRAKQARLRRLAREWLASRRGLGGVRAFRFDVIGVLFERDGKVLAYEHIRDAF